jgi:hypothetical protein
MVCNTRRSHCRNGDETERSGGMSTEKFTPGEWKVQEFYYENGKRTVYEIVYNEEGDRVAEGVDKKADAYLMAASKDFTMHSNTL